MSGNIMGLGAVISGIIKRGITHISFVISFVFVFFSGAGRLFVGGNCRFLFPYAVFFLEEGHQTARFWIFTLHFSLLLTCFVCPTLFVLLIFCLSIACISFANRHQLPSYLIF